MKKTLLLLTLITAPLFAELSQEATALIERCTSDNAQRTQRNETHTSRTTQRTDHPLGPWFASARLSSEYPGPNSELLSGLLDAYTELDSSEDRAAVWKQLTPRLGAQWANDTPYDQRAANTLMNDVLDAEYDWNTFETTPLYQTIKQAADDRVRGSNTNDPLSLSLASPNAQYYGIAVVDAEKKTREFVVELKRCRTSALSKSVAQLQERYNKAVHLLNASGLTLLAARISMISLTESYKDLHRQISTICSRRIIKDKQGWVEKACKVSSAIYLPNANGQYDSYNVLRMYMNEPKYHEKKLFAKNEKDQKHADAQKVLDALGKLKKDRDRLTKQLSYDCNKRVAMMQSQQSSDQFEHAFTLEFKELWQHCFTTMALVSACFDARFDHTEHRLTLFGDTFMTIGRASTEIETFAVK